MLTKITVNKKNIVGNFLGPINRLTESATVNITPKSIYSVANTEDGSIILFAKLNAPNAIKGEVKLNISSMAKLMHALNCIDADDVVLEVDENNIKYNSPGLKFKYHLLDDGVLTTPLVDITKIAKMTFDTEFTISKAKLSELIKGSTFASDTSKIYMSFRDSKVFGELTDKKFDLADTITFELADNYTGQGLEHEMALDLEILRILSALKADSITTKINTTLGLPIFEIRSTDFVLKYIVAPTTE